VIDNLRAAVTRADWFDPELNPKVEEFCRHYGTVMLPTRPAMVPTEGVETSKQNSLIFAWMRKNIINKRYCACFASLGILLRSEDFRILPQCFCPQLSPKNCSVLFFICS